MISRDLAIKFPEIITTPAYIALKKLGTLRSTKELGIDIDMLQRDYKAAMRKIDVVIIDDLEDDHPATEAEKAKLLYWYNKCFPETPKAKATAPVEETTRQPEPPAVVPAASVAQDASASPDVSLQAGVEVGVASLCSLCRTFHVEGPCPKPEIPDFLKEALKGIE